MLMLDFIINLFCQVDDVMHTPGNRIFLLQR